jgi:hypothetical protein
VDRRSAAAVHRDGEPRAVTLEHDPFKLNRIMLSFFFVGRIFYGEPVPTSPENALKAGLKRQWRAQ